MPVHLYPLLGVQVDVIVSEWMGLLLVQESVLDSVLHVRQLRHRCLSFFSGHLMFLSSAQTDGVAVRLVLSAGEADWPIRTPSCAGPDKRLAEMP